MPHFFQPFGARRGLIAKPAETDQQPFVRWISPSRLSLGGGVFAVAALVSVVWSWTMLRKSTPVVPSTPWVATWVQATSRTPIDVFLQLTDKDPSVRTEALTRIRDHWSDGDEVFLVEIVRYCKDSRTRRAITRALTDMTGQPFGGKRNDWYRWIWNRDVDLHPDYVLFKRKLYERLDPSFADYFDPNRKTTIRMDEIRWGGVRRDGIPPLKNPETIPADQADYLDDQDVVFGVAFGGDARAYPKRILAWHEMVKDVVGDLSINGAYCTLCGSMIVYRTEHEGQHYELGTSGFLYRSNKLMYDHKTKSLWSTMKGEPVVGPLVGRGIRLEPLYVVTTTWGEWRRRHPETDVLSLRTGYGRDYGEGVAYRNYFATDRLMFDVPIRDERLKNKDEVLVVRLDEDKPLAMTADYLSEHRIYHDSIGDQQFVVLTDSSGANRVYETGGKRFVRWVDDRTVQAEDETVWSVKEDRLAVHGATGVEDVSLVRLPAHRAFWFAWYVTHPSTRLVK